MFVYLVQVTHLMMKMFRNFSLICFFLFLYTAMWPVYPRWQRVLSYLIFSTTYAVGGLLNASFGNATELIISIHALKGGMIRVVQQSLLGSILSNMLLVLGCAFFSGGIVFLKKEQVFDKVYCYIIGELHTI